MNVKDAVKKKVGRPAGQRAPSRPVLAARVPEDAYEKIAAAAKISGRTMSEELVWRANQSFVWEAQYGNMQAMVQEIRDKAVHITETTTQIALDAELMRRGYHKVRGVNGYAWFPPGVNSITWIDPPLLDDLEAYMAAKKSGGKS
jgi:uncharacterized protein (DUF1778 family)